MDRTTLNENVTEQGDRVAWHAEPVEHVEELLETSSHGLTGAEAAARLERFGPNQIREEQAPSDLLLLLSQLRSPLIYILIIAAVVTVIVGEYLDTVIIVFVLIVNTIIGFVQERQAARSVLALQQLLTPQATVVRDGQPHDIDSRELVPGDVVMLESGQHVPADLRLTSTTGLMVDESLLTGESVPVMKHVEPLPTGAVLADRENLAFTGTTVVRGRASGYVVATGAATQVGEIAGSIREAEAVATPLQRDVVRLSQTLGIIVAIAAVLAFGIGIAGGESINEMFLVAVALAVAAVPEGLPVAHTVTLALGVRRMASRNVVIRRLSAVEALGSTTTIGSDKTGTLTENRMTVRQIWAGHRLLNLAGDGRPAPSPDGNEPLQLTLLAGVLANEADIEPSGDDFNGRGDPTEVALLVAAERLGMDVEETRKTYSSAKEFPFEPERQYAATVRARPGEPGYLTLVKGAPERVMAMCDRMLTASGVEPLDRDAVSRAAAEMGNHGLRVLGMAFREDDRVPDDLENPEEMVFAGLQGMIDPPREGVSEAIEGCHQAGIRVLMITGDHSVTAGAIGRDIGIGNENEEVIAGAELEKIDDERLRDRVRDTEVFARVAPEDKLRIVRALQANNQIVAVTGDGVNDAPALRSADIGIAMGESGTDVAREAADMVLTDDNFANIFAAVREGRVTFDNLRKVTFFLIATNVAEILAVLAALSFGWPLPFLPAQILWLNLVTEGVQHIALAFEPGEEGIVNRRPRPPGEGIINRLLWERTILSGIVMTIGTLILFRRELNLSDDLVVAQTVALTTMVLYEAFQVFNARSSRSIFRTNPFRNPFLFIATAAALALHIGALYFPPTQYVLRVEPLPLSTWVWIVPVGATIVIAMELHKLLRPNPFEPRGGD